jgi:hypothetical protein
VDLVLVLAPAVEHAQLAKIAIAAGKDVYSEWPLITSTADLEELLALAEANPPPISRTCSLSGTSGLPVPHGRTPGCQRAGYGPPLCGVRPRP